MNAAMLATMRPDSFDDEGAGLQQRKSIETRRQILEAAIDCIVADGYSKLSTQSVCERAGVSRGAMHHHYPTRQKLVAALVEYVLYRRLEFFLANYKKQMPGKGHFVDRATDVHWRMVGSREYAAYLELAVAARTDPELNAHYLPASRKFDNIWRDEMVRRFPEWKEHFHDMWLAHDLTQVVHMGLLLHVPIYGNGKRLRMVRDILKSINRELFRRYPLPDMPDV